MGEFTAKKLGEVLAFCRTGIFLAEKSGPAMVKALGESEDARITGALMAHAAELEKIANEAGVKDITFLKAEKTGAKLRSMMEMYVGDEWENMSEIMEWMGFQEGSAIVHWQLVSGSAEAMNHEGLRELSKKAIEFHKDILNKVSEALKKIGK